VFEKLFDKLNDLSDILNVGRMVFYTGAGLLPVAVLFAFGKTVATPRSELDELVLRQFAHDLGSLADRPFLAFYLSLLVGFVIMAGVYSIVIEPIFSRIRSTLDDGREPDKRSFHFLFPRMVNNPETDYQAWLIREEWRYVELVALLPVGLMIAVVALVGYSLVFLWLRVDLPGQAPGPDLNHFVPLILTGFFGFLYGGVWAWWKRRIVESTARGYQSAKLDLKDGLEAFKEFPFRPRKS
jgi:hypothetical protein